MEITAATNKYFNKTSDCTNSTQQANENYKYNCSLANNAAYKHACQDNFPILVSTATYWYEPAVRACSINKKN